MKIHEKTAFDSICALLGEHFDSFVVLVRSADGVRRWSLKDQTWVHGACDRLLTRMRGGDTEAGIHDSLRYREDLGDA